MDLFSLNSVLADALLNNVISAVVLTTIAIIAIRWIPARLPRLQGNIIIGVFTALLVLPILRFALPVVGTEFSLPSAKESSSESETIPSPITEAEDPFPYLVLDPVVYEETSTEILPKSPSVPDPRPNLHWSVIVTLIWGLGIAVAMTRLIIGWFRLRRLARALSPVSDPALGDLWKKVAGAEAKKATLVVSPNHTDLFVFGLRHPCIAVPKDLLARANESEALSLLTHEWAHIRNGDLLIGHLQRGLTVIYWWLPTIYWLNKRLSLSRETLADTAAAARVDNPTLYAHSLLNLAAQACRKESSAMGVIGIAGSRSALAQRLTTLSKHYEQMKMNLQNPHPFRAPLAILGLCSLCLGVHFTNAQDTESSTPAEVTAPDPIKETAPLDTTAPLETTAPLGATAPPPEPPRPTAPLLGAPTPPPPISKAEYTDATAFEPNEIRSAKAEAQRVLADLQRELASTKMELKELKLLTKQLAEERMRITGPEGEFDFTEELTKERLGLANTYEEGDLYFSDEKEQKEGGLMKGIFGEDAAKAQRGEMEKQRDAALELVNQARQESNEARQRANEMRKRAAEDEVAMLREKLATIEHAALHEQTRELQETVQQAVTEALRAATEEIRKEFEKNNNSSTDTTIEN